MEKSSDMEGNFSPSPPSPACPEPSGVTHIYGVTLWASHVTGELSPTFGREGGGCQRYVIQPTRTV